MSQLPRVLLSLASLALLLALLNGCFLIGSGTEATGDPLVNVNSDDPFVVQGALQLIRRQNEIRAVEPLIENLDREESQVRSLSYTTLVTLLMNNRFITVPETLTLQQREIFATGILEARFNYTWGEPNDPGRAASVKRWRAWFDKYGEQEIERYIATGTPPEQPSLMQRVGRPLPPAEPGSGASEPEPAPSGASSSDAATERPERG